jgi:hypothetical protein
MEADYDIFEIVSVIHDYWLLDAESYQRKYFPHDGEPLEPGYYVVNWAEHIQRRRFNEHAVFHGPFKSRKEAQEACDGMLEEWKCALTRPSDRHTSFAKNLKGMNVKKAA